MTGNLKTYLVLAGLLFLLPACIPQTSEFAGNSMPPNPVAIDVYHVDWTAGGDEAGNEQAFQNWLRQNRINADDHLVIITSPNSKTDLTYLTAIWAEHSPRPVKIYNDLPAGDAALTVRLYRRYVKAASCYDGEGRYILGCAVRHNRQLSLYQLNPPRITEVTRPALYETVPDQRVLAFEKPGWIKAGDGK